MSLITVAPDADSSLRLPPCVGGSERSANRVFDLDNRSTQFCEIYRRRVKRRGLTMRQVHRADEKCFVDYAGQIQLSQVLRARSSCGGPLLSARL